MKNNAKRVLALAAAGVIALGAAGCGASGGSSGQNASGGAGTNAAAEAGSEQKEFRIFAGVSSLSPDNSEKPLVKQMNEAMGVTIDWDCVSGDSLTEKKNLVLNAGSDLPDALMGADLTDNELITSGANGQFIPLEGYINETVMPNLSAVIQKRPNLLASATMPDGHIYGLPRVSEMGFQYSDGNEYQIGAIPQFTAINTKWLDEAGLKMPETVEELSRRARETGAQASARIWRRSDARTITPITGRLRTARYTIRQQAMSTRQPSPIITTGTRKG